MLTELLLFLSGLAALVYQTLWVKQLSLVVGVDVYAVTVAVSAFFAGLALGGLLCGRFVERVERPFVLYALLEAGTALFGLGCTLALPHVVSLFLFLQAAAGLSAWLFLFVLIGLPAFWMGGTLPVLMRAVDPSGAAAVGRISGRLYAANTAGSIVGTLVASFFLIRAFGIRGAALAAGCCNLAAAGIALFGVEGVRDPESTGKVEPVTAEGKGAGLALILYALAGGIALGYEVVWFKAIAQFLSAQAVAFSVMLAVYLFGLAAGSAIYSRCSGRDRDPWSTFGLLISSAGLSALFLFTVIGGWLPKVQYAIWKFLVPTAGAVIADMGRFLFGGVVMVLLPTLLLGAAFPVAMRLIVTRHTGRESGRVVAWNLAGGIVGTFLTGFLLVPALGLVHTLEVLALAAATVGGAALLYGGFLPRRALSLATVIAGIACLAFFLPGDKFARLLALQKGGKVVFYHEGAGGTVAVLKQHSSSHTFRRLYINGVSNSGDTLASLRYMRLQALLPLLIHRGEPRSALVVGLGTGITCGALLADPELDKRVCAELLPSVVRAASLFQGNEDVTRDRRVEIRIADGRHELLRNRERYDLITLEPPPPSAAGVVNLYSRDFYALCRDRLNPDGLMAQWWPLATQNDEDSRSLVRSFLDVFPYVTLWTTELHEMMLVGSMNPIRLSSETIAERFNRPTIRAALAEVGIASPSALLATYMTGRKGLEKYVGPARPVTDDHPRIEYAAPVRQGEFVRVLSRLLALRESPSLKDGSVPSDAVLSEGRLLMTFYRAGLAAYRGDRKGWTGYMQKVFHSDRRNPYYAWFVSGG